MYDGVSAVLRGGIIVSDLALKWGQSISMGWLHYSTKWVNLATKHAHHTHTTINQHEQMSGRGPTLQWLGPPSSMGRTKLPPNHCTAAPLRVCAGRDPSGWGSLPLDGLTQQPTEGRRFRRAAQWAITKGVGNFPFPWGVILWSH